MQCTRSLSFVYRVNMKKIISVIVLLSIFYVFPLVRMPLLQRDMLIGRWRCDNGYTVCFKSGGMFEASENRSGKPAAGCDKSGLTAFTAYRKLSDNTLRLYKKDGRGENRAYMIMFGGKEMIFDGDKYHRADF